MTPEENYQKVSNSYVNWLTSIAIANFVYVTTITEINSNLPVPLIYNLFNFQISNSDLRLLDLCITSLSLFFMFLFRTFGFLACYCDRNKNVVWSRKWENPRGCFFVIFMIAFLVMLVLSLINIATPFFYP